MQYADWVSLYRFQKRHHGPIRGFIRTFRKNLRRTFSRQLLQKYISPSDRGLELGAGECTISPIRQTLLTDGHKSHAGAPSLAKEFFPAETIPYGDHSFDFLINEHVLEHLPDAIRGLNEWKRVLKPNGTLFLFLPHPERTFDRYRPVTAIDHFFRDFELKVDSSEDFHSDEWKANVIDRGLAPHYQPYGKEESLKTNLIHRHVFTPASVTELLEKLGWKIVEKIDLVPDRNDSFVIVAKPHTQN